MKVAIMGYGTIGSGVAEILDVNRDVIAKRCGEPLELKYVLDLREFEGDPNADKIVHDYKVIAEDPEIEMVVETMGGVEPAYTFVKTMLLAKKHVCTSNKALVADKGAELIAIARENNVNFEFEASVGGGIADDGGTEITFTEDLNAKKVLLKPLLKNYMKKQQAQYFEDLKKVLDF